MIISSLFTLACIIIGCKVGVLNMMEFCKKCQLLETLLYVRFT